MEREVKGSQVSCFACILLTKRALTRCDYMRVLLQFLLTAILKVFFEFVVHPVYKPKGLVINGAIILQSICLVIYETALQVNMLSLEENST